MSIRRVRSTVGSTGHLAESIHWSEFKELQYQDAFPDYNLALPFYIVRGSGPAIKPRQWPPKTSQRRRFRHLALPEQRRFCRRLFCWAPVRLDQSYRRHHLQGPSCEHAPKVVVVNSLIEDQFTSHYNGATDAGFIRGGYHFARPASSSGEAQATYFLSNGGGWSDDGITLPGMLDMEADCSSMTAAETVAWVQDFVDTYHGSTGRYPIIYTSRSWWQSCTGDSDAFSKTCPLHLASWNNSPGTIPGGWGAETIWQYNDASSWGGDSDQFIGTIAELKALAKGS
ncbi:hypothetical protein P152DRAFT_456127 [Eremomyces bilateralis CBS 781.70]|uniref:N,O-diacetylmuramidase n=1 Tax=Eremomyces bilateralis CBS 781.70 TaxID=1392243 RepID=A0A6G1GAH9_9PEZI|nr:uncharacterized protein P152DRAFT_456127 [Eremomyces bilateralis CBS 781.70]KAF1815088.1 hypothetical protein P152DRAFT_456127 [Eremomyces bilateralis CBS 781.70]